MIEISARKVDGISVVPVYVGGSNSLLFQVAGLVDARLRTMMLGRELLNKRRACVAVRLQARKEAEALCREFNISPCQ